MVSRIANDRESKSITTDVPVYLVWPAVRGPDRPLMYQRRVQLEAEPVVVAREGAVEVGDHRGDRGSFEDPRAVVATAVQEGLGQNRQVVGGAEHTRVPGDAVEGPGVFVVHRTPDHPRGGAD